MTDSLQNIHQTLDASGLSCPLPILRTAKQLAQMNSGETLLVITTDPGAKKDFPAYARQTGHVLVESSENAGKFNFVLRKK